MSDRPRTHIRVTMDGKSPKYELMDSGSKVRDVTTTEIIGMIMQFASSLRWRIDFPDPD